MIGNPRYGRIGMLVLPYYLAFELLGPAVELVGIITVVFGVTLGTLDISFALLFATVAVLYGILLSIAALTIEELTFHRYHRWRDIAVGIGASVLENVGYRQLHAYWRMRGLIASLRGRPAAWGDMERTGFASEP